MLAWCAGMYASGSTWLFNAIRETWRHLDGTGPPASGFVNTPADLAALDGPGRLVVKTHDCDPAAAAALRDRAGAVFVTVRDPRDAVTSLMLYQRHGFQGALAAVAGSAGFCAALADRPEVRVLRYEDGFADDPATLDVLAAALGGRLAGDARARIHAELGRAAVEQRIAALAHAPGTRHDAPSGDFFDPATQWHRHHAGRTGEVGRWRRMLAEGQVKQVQLACAGAMQRFGYVPAPPAPPVFGLSGIDPFRLAQ